MAIKPSIQTIRTYYSKTILSDEHIIRIMDFVIAHQGTIGISPENKIFAALISWEECKLKDVV